VNATDLQRYKRLLLAKRDELSGSHADASFLAAGAGGPMGDLADQANADADADLHIRLHQSDAHLLRAIEDALARIDSTGPVWRVRDVRFPHLQGATGACAVDAPVSRLQGARTVSRLRTISDEIRTGFR
jgi:hypothetical protein